ncbi:MAG: GntR family transcriptional regulator [Solirubrobacteraceae bacterium]|nr:GntR family transcriptional regulator [Solirubrobacteraceae bacterium]
MSTPQSSEGAAPRVDATEQALRRWLTPGTHRPGDRLPPEQDLAAQLGVSRGTLRAALERLERNGLIVRRRGSGTFVGELPVSGSFDAGLERLEPYSELAARQGMTIGALDVQVALEQVQDAAVASALGLEVGAYARVVTRTMMADGEPAAWMRDTIADRPGVPDEAALLRRVLDGGMVLDALVDAGSPVTYARSEVDARTVGSEPRAQAALGCEPGDAVLALTETMCLSDGTPVQHSVNLFAPGRLRLHVMRLLLDGGPPR